MKRTVVVLFAAVLGLAAPGWADKLQDDLDKLTAGLPKDVAAVLTRRVACNHWMGEEPYDKARAREIERAIRQNKCDSLAGDEAACASATPTIQRSPKLSTRPRTFDCVLIV
jgi:hypothetical protein